MGNLTEDGNHTAIRELFCRTGHNGLHQKIIISALNIPLSITAFLGNLLIIVALQKVSSLHPPSKLLLGCLASTDLCVGLIAQPLYVSFLWFSAHSKHCYYLNVVTFSISVLLCGVSLLALTAISVDRLLALLLGLKYRQMVTLRRVLVVVIIIWISSVAVVMTVLNNFRTTTGIACLILLFCVTTSTFCYSKIYLTLRHHQAQVQDRFHQGQVNGEGNPLNIARYRKTVSSALWVQMILLGCYLPYGIVGAVRAVTDTSSLYLAWDVTLSLLFLNSSLNPLLYCWKIRQVRQAVKDTIRQLFCLSS
ncbi:melanocyte-stimulating hormone receptor-like [Oculina patagonica]